MTVSCFMEPWCYCSSPVDRRNISVVYYNPPYPQFSKKKHIETQIGFLSSGEYIESVWGESNSYPFMSTFKPSKACSLYIGGPVKLYFATSSHHKTWLSNCVLPVGMMHNLVIFLLPKTHNTLHISIVNNIHVLEERTITFLSSVS